MEVGHNYDDARINVEQKDVQDVCAEQWCQMNIVF